LERLLAELGDQHWDLLVFTETWRADGEEAFDTEHGHSWFGSGGTRGRCGVGFLLHSRWRHNYFKPLNERCAALGIRINKQLRIRFVAVYMPHSGHNDIEVETLYAMLDAECKAARENCESLVIGGDLNAEVGGRDLYDDTEVLGDNPTTYRSDRGCMLLQWCSLRQLALANTFNCHSAEAAWTYRNGDARRQLDYFLTDMALVKLTLTCLVLACVDIGSDHRPVLLELACSAPKKRKRKKKSCSKTWRPDNAYVQKVSATLAEVRPPNGVDTMAACIQNVLVQSLPDNVSDADGDAAVSQTPADAAIHALIQQRRELAMAVTLSPENKKQQRIDIGKSIQKLIRKRLVDQKTAKISKVLAEFRDLKQLKALTGRRPNTTIVEVLDKEGSSCRSKSERAEVLLLSMRSSTGPDTQS